MTSRAFPGYTNAGNDDAYVRVYDADGVESWTRQFGTQGWDYAVATSWNADGDLYVVGDVDGALPGMTPAGENDAFVRKYDADGQELWTRQFGSAADEYTADVAVDVVGNVYVLGDSFGDFAGHTNVGSSDMFLRKYDADGVLQWTRHFGGADLEHAATVVAWSDTAVYVVGTTRESISGQPFAGASDVVVRKYDSVGNALWTRTLGSIELEFPNAAAVDSSGSVVVVGQTYGTLPGQVPRPGREAFVWKWDASGVEQWGTQFLPDSTGASAGAGAVAIDALGNIVVGGSATGALDGQFNLGGGDAFVRMYDVSGAVSWTRQFGSSMGDGVCGVGLDAAGLVYVSGSTSGAIPSQVSSGLTDRYLLRLTPVAP